MSEIDYLQAPDCPEEAALRRIKGNYRRFLVEQHIREDGFDSIPYEWLAHNPSSLLVELFGMQDPSYRGGEDLPDLDEEQVEIARMTLVNSVHGEVTSLRAKPHAGGGIEISMVGEYDTEYALPQNVYESALPAEEIIRIFEEADPSPMETSCEIDFMSYFYPDLNQ